MSRTGGEGRSEGRGGDEGTDGAARRGQVGHRHEQALGNQHRGDDPATATGGERHGDPVPGGEAPDDVQPDQLRHRRALDAASRTRPFATSS